MDLLSYWNIGIVGEDNGVWDGENVDVNLRIWLSCVVYLGSFVDLERVVVNVGNGTEVR